MFILDNYFSNREFDPTQFFVAFRWRNVD